jgi:acyl carrier protein
MSPEEIMSELGDIIRRTFRQPDAEVDRQTTALDIDGWDSLSHTMLILDVEKHFGVRLPADRIHELDDVGELADLIAEVKGAA